MVALDVVVVVVVALLAFLVAGLLRSNAELTRSLHQLGFDLSPAPTNGTTTPVSLQPRPTPARPDASDVVDLAGVTPAGDAVSRAVSDVRHDTLVAFLTSGCQTCRTMWDSFRSGVTDVPGGARLVVVTRGPEAESPAAVGQLAGDELPVVMSTSTWEHYDVPYAPYFVYVSGPAGRVTGEGVAGSWEQVKTLLANAVADGTTHPLRSPPTEPDVGRTWAKAKADAEREARIDQELDAAGILPGDPRLHPSRLDRNGPRS